MFKYYDYQYITSILFIAGVEDSKMKQKIEYCISQIK